MDDGGMMWWAQAGAREEYEAWLQKLDDERRQQLLKGTDHEQRSELENTPVEHV